MTQTREKFYDDGWDCDAVTSFGLRDTLRKLSSLQYDIEHNRRSACKFGDTLEDLKAYILELAGELEDAAEWLPSEDEE